MKTHALLDQAAQYGIRLGLERVTDLTRDLGSPQLGFPTFHVAGTNGKGSTTTMIAAALSASGRRTGSYLSPHLVDINERIRVDGVPVSDALLDASIRNVGEVCKAAGIDHRLTWFEWITLAAWVAFREMAVDCAVVEVGLGGRLDATRVLAPLATGITSIGLDHIDVLGPTRVHIAREKVAIAQPGIPLVFAVEDADAARAIRAYARGICALPWQVGREIELQRVGSQIAVQTPVGRVGPFYVGMEGAHQARNAAVAVGMLHAARLSGFVIDDEAIVQGLANAHLGGRLVELLPGLWADGAHNAEGAAALAQALAVRDRPAKRVLITGMNAPRNPDDVLRPLAPHFDRVIAVRSHHADAHEPALIVSMARKLGLEAACAPSVGEALVRARASEGEVWVAGSLYLLGDVMAALGLQGT